MGMLGIHHLSGLGLSSKLVLAVVPLSLMQFSLVTRPRQDFRRDGKGVCLLKEDPPIIKLHYIIIQ